MANHYKIAIIGDYNLAKPSHKATEEAIMHCAAHLELDITHEWVPTESLCEDADKLLCGYDGFWCAPGSPYRSIAGALNGIRYARESGRAFIGTCGGFQHAVLEFAINVLGISSASHQEYSPDAPDPIVKALSCDLRGGAKRVILNKESQVYKIYGQTETDEMFTCSYGLNPGYIKILEESGFKTAGVDENGEPRILELAGHRFFIASLFQPQITSTPQNPHRLVLAFLNAIAGI